MTITAQLADGRTLEFPDGTDPSVVQRTVKNVVAGKIGLNEHFATNYRQGQYPQGSGIGRTLVSGLPLVGGIAGGMAAGVPGAAIGADIGTIAKQGIEGLYYGKPMTAGGMLKEQALQSGGMAAGEGLGRYVLDPALRKGAAVVAGKLWPERTGAAAAQQLLRKYGGTLTASQAVKGGVPETAEKLGQLGIFGKPIYEKLSEVNQNALKQARDELISRYSSVPTEKIAKRSGTSLQSVLKAGTNAFEDAADKMYANFSDMVSKAASAHPTGVPTTDYLRAFRTGVSPQAVSEQAKLVDMTPVRKWAASEATKYTRLGKAPPAVIKDILNTPKAVTFADAQFDRSLALKRLRDLQTGTSKDAASQAYYKQLQGKILDQMDAAAKRMEGTNPELYKEYRAISDFYRRGKQAFSNDFILSLLDKDPSVVAKSIYGPGKTGEITQLRAALSAAKHLQPSLDVDGAMNKLKAAYLNELFTRGSTRGEEGAVKGAAVESALSQEKNLRTITALFGNDAPNIRALVRSMRVAQAPTSSGGGLQMAIPLAQGAAAGALLGVASYGMFGRRSAASGAEASELLGASVILVAPRVLAKMLTNPDIVDALLKLRTMTRANPKFLPLLSKVLAEETVVKQGVENPIVPTGAARAPAVPLSLPGQQQTGGQNAAP